MPATLESPARALVADKIYPTLSVPREDGSILSVVIWADVDADDNIVVNSAEGRAWPRLLRAAGQATITWSNPADPMEFVSITAKLTGDTHDGADAGIDALTKKYMNVDSYPGRSADEQRVQFTLTPERVTHKS